MGRSIPVQIGEKNFGSKGNLSAHIRAMIGRYSVMEVVEGDDEVFCRNLFRHHPNYKEKLGSGFQSIQVRLDIYGKRYFHIHRTDGSDDDISWSKCVAAIK